MIPPGRRSQKLQKVPQLQVERPDELTQSLHTARGSQSALLLRSTQPHVRSSTIVEATPSDYIIILLRFDISVAPAATPTGPTLQVSGLTTPSSPLIAPHQ